MPNNELIRKIERLQVITTARATGQSVTNDDEYVQLRNELIKNSIIKEKLPSFLFSCSTLSEFWIHIKQKYAHYNERREYIRSAFEPSLIFLQNTSTSTETIRKITKKIPHISEEAQKMAEAYTTLHVLENQLRIFIQEKLKEKYAEEWWEKSVSSNTKKECENRKKKELNSPWHDVEESHMIFYTTFEELQGIIRRNWAVFQPFFIDQNTAIGRLIELEIPRNTIAHNRILKSTELDRLNIFSHDILRCMYQENEATLSVLDTNYKKIESNQSLKNIEYSEIKEVKKNLLEALYFFPEHWETYKNLIKTYELRYPKNGEISWCSEQIKNAIIKARILNLEKVNEIIPHIENISNKMAQLGKVVLDRFPNGLSGKGVNNDPNIMVSILSQGNSLYDESMKTISIIEQVFLLFNFKN